MKYTEAIEVLYNQAPMFQHLGKKAYKTGLDNTYRLDDFMDFPHKKYKTVHVAGTNGKGSTSHMMAAILQKSGYKVGLYTSPHLRDFRERIRINGEMISEEAVCDFVERTRGFIEDYHPSFFEITTAIAFKYFEEQGVDVAVIEVGLGGRLDCTNIITPEVSVITNISMDHTDLLGATLQEIAREKAGVIKKGVPVVIGERQKEVENIFVEKADEAGAPIVFASDVMSDAVLPECEMKGLYQDKNRRTVLAAVDVLRERGSFVIPDAAVAEGMKNVCRLTGIMGRWQTVSENPRVICDTGHNEAGVKFVVEQLNRMDFDVLRIVIGMVSDKAIDKILALLPKNAVYYFAKADIPRGLDAGKLKAQAEEYGLNGESYSSVKEAFETAKMDCGERDLVFVGGSNFTVAEIL